MNALFFISSLEQSNLINYVPSNDFSFYDQVLDTAYDFGVIPERYNICEPGFETYFAMARGIQKNGKDVASNVRGLFLPKVKISQWSFQSLFLC